MTKGSHRVGIRCSNCDHPIVTLPENYHCNGTLTCSVCGETFELPETPESLLERAEKGLEKAVKRRDRSAG